MVVEFEAHLEQHFLLVCNLLVAGRCNRVSIMVQSYWTEGILGIDLLDVYPQCRTTHLFEVTHRSNTMLLYRVPFQEDPLRRDPSLYVLFRNCSMINHIYDILPCIH